MAQSPPSVHFPIVTLAGDVSRLFRRRFDAAVRGFGVTGSQWRVLCVLGQQPGLSQTRLAAALDVEAISAGRMIDRLEKAGLVARRPDPSDRRVWLLETTPAAASLLDQLRSTAHEVIAEMLSGFTPEEAETLRALLERLRDNAVTAVSEAT